VGIDAYNPGPQELEVRMQCHDGPAYRAALPAGRVERLKTGWHQSCSEVSVELGGGAGPVHFDNLAYVEAAPR